MKIFIALLISFISLNSYAYSALNENDVLEIRVIDFNTNGNMDSDYTHRGFKPGVGKADFGLRLVAKRGNPVTSFIKDFKIDEQTDTISISIKELADIVAKSNTRRNLDRSTIIEYLQSWEYSLHLVEYDWAGLPHGMHYLFVGKADGKVSLNEIERNGASTVVIADSKTGTRLTLEFKVIYQ